MILRRLPHARLGTWLATAWTLAASTILASQAVAQDIPDSFFATESAYPAARGDLEATAGFEYELDAEPGAPNGAMVAGLEYGITDHLTMSAEVPWVLSRDSTAGDGFGDVSAGLLYNVCCNTGPTAISFSTAVTFPTADRQSDESSHHEVELFMNVARSFGIWQLHMNVGTELTGGSGVLINTALLMQRPAFVAAFELSGSSEERTLMAIPSMRWNFQETVALKVGVAMGLTGESAGPTLLSAVSFEF